MQPLEQIPWIVKGSRLPTDAQTAVDGLGNDVKMHVKNRLMGLGAIILEHVIGRSARRRHNRPGETWQDATERRS